MIKNINDTIQLSQIPLDVRRVLLQAHRVNKKRVAEYSIQQTICDIIRKSATPADLPDLEEGAPIFTNVCPPEEWIEFFFQLQTELVGFGYLEGMCFDSLQEFAVKFLALKKYFVNLKNNHQLCQQKPF